MNYAKPRSLPFCGFYFLVSQACKHLSQVLTGTEKNQSETQSYFDINTELTKQIYDYFLSTSTKKFIFFSSVKAVADTVEGAFLTEEVVPNPKGPYGESKVRADKIRINRCLFFDLV